MWVAVAPDCHTLEHRDECTNGNHCSIVLELMDILLITLTERLSCAQAFVFTFRSQFY